MHYCLLIKLPLSRFHGVTTSYRGLMESETEIVDRIQAISLSPSISNAEIRRAQLLDADIKHLLQWKEEGTVRPTWKDVSSLSSAIKTYWVNWDLLEVKDGALTRRWESDDGKEKNWKIVLPRSLRQNILEELHSSNTGCHLGMNKLLHKTQQRFHWVGLTADVRSFIRKCTVCAQLKNPPKKKRAPLQQYRVGSTLERVAADILGPLPETEKGNKYVLVVGDYFTKWVEAYPLPNQEASTIARVLVNEFICRYGVPKELHTDQGRNFESTLMLEVCKLLGVKKTRTCPFHPRGDGFVERFNRTLISMVAAILDPDENQKDWDEKIPLAMLAYRSSVQESTGETPSMMMLGREITLPVDVMVTSPPSTQKEGDFACNLREKLQDVHEAARVKLKLAAQKQARSYDRNTVLRSFEMGDWVWLHGSQRKRGVCPKFVFKWSGPYLVVNKLSDVVYRIQLSSRSRPKVVHLDRLKEYMGPKLKNWLVEQPLRRNPPRKAEKPRRYQETVA